MGLRESGVRKERAYEGKVGLGCRTEWGECGGRREGGERVRDYTPSFE